MSACVSVCVSVSLFCFCPPVCRFSYLRYIIFNPKHCGCVLFLYRKLREERGVNVWKLDAMDQKGPDVGKLLARALSAISISSSWGRCLAFKGPYMAGGSGVYGIPVPFFPPSI